MPTTQPTIAGRRRTRRTFKPEPPRVVDQVMSVIEVAEMTGLHKNSVMKACREGRIVARLAGGTTWIIDRASALAYWFPDHV
jgi:hypothetical protein